MERRLFLLLGAAAVGLTSCTFGDSPHPPSEPDPDAAVRASVAASELALAAAYRSAIAAAPDLAADLEPLLAHHLEHLSRIAPELATGEVAPSGSPAATDVTVEALAEAETRAQDERTAACVGAKDAGLARDLCLIAASEAQHAALLTRLARAAGS